MRERILSLGWSHLYTASFFFKCFLCPCFPSLVMTDSTPNTVFSIEGKGLKLNTADDVKEFVEAIVQMEDLEVIRLSGNTIGVEAAQALAGALKSKKTLKVNKKGKG